ncbi:unnamed protein product, partial [Discosporangium mesarthrocarpum]
MMSLRVARDGQTVQVGFGGESPVIVEYALEERQGAVRDGHEALRGHTVVDSPSGAGGLYAVLGPGDTVQVRSRTGGTEGEG